jgi:hypothetical protein
MKTTNPLSTFISMSALLLTLSVLVDGAAAADLGTYNGIGPMPVPKCGDHVNLYANEPQWPTCADAVKEADAWIATWQLTFDNNCFRAGGHMNIIGKGYTPGPGLCNVIPSLFFGTTYSYVEQETLECVCGSPLGPTPTPTPNW